MAESREKIKSRMLRTASKMWGYSEDEAETSFDPLVSMLLTSCASELVNISQEISDSQSRITEKLIELLSPDTVSGVIPSHAIACGRPLEPSYLLQPDYQFFYNKKIRDSQKNTTASGKDIFFSSTLPINLVDGNVKYYAYGNHIYEIDKHFHKDILDQGSKSLPDAHLYIGVELNEQIKKLDGLSFFFDSNHLIDKKLFFYNLKNSDWSLGNTPITMTPGYGHNLSELFKKDASAGFDHMVNRYADTLEHVNRYYESNFVTVQLSKKTLSHYRKDNEGDNYPAAFADCFKEDILNDISTPDVIWFKVTFSSVVTESMLSSTFCSTNTFPVVNKRFQTSIFKLKKYLNIIPILTDDYFLDIERVQDSDGVNYIKKEIDNSQELNTGELLIRTDGMGRFNSRNASQFLAQLLELLRDESASFSVFGKDALSKEVKNLNQLISRLEQRVDLMKVKNNVTYFLLKGSESQNNLFLDFYTTNGTLANGIKKGVHMKPFVGSEMKNGIRLLTETIGGRDKLDYEGRINAYRSSLLSRDKIVTKEDVRAKCLSHFENRISDVTLKDGYMESLSLKGGFIRTIDIHLHPTNVKSNTNEWQQLCKDLLVSLESKSVNIFPFRFFLNDKIIITD